MSWTDAFKLTVSGLVLGTAAAALAGTIVIRSSGPSAKAYPTGKPLAEGQRVTLKNGDTLVLLDGRGTRTLTGAGSFDVGAAASGPATASAFAALIGNAGTRQVRTGAVRGNGTGRPRVASLWHIDTSKSGTVCLNDMNRATFWRPDMTTATVLTLAHLGKSVPIAFAEGQAMRSWPMADMPLKAGGEYRISGPGMATPVIIKIASLASAGMAPDEVATALIGQGCNAQLDVLVEAGKPIAGTG